MAVIGEMQKLTIGNKTYTLPSGGGGEGSVTSVGVSNATNGGLSVSGSPITTSGTITVGHSNVLSSAQTTQAVYPIKIDKNGHISEYGTAVTSMPASDVSSWAKQSSKPSYTASEVGAADSSHSHGDISNSGDCTTNTTIASGDRLMVNDESASRIRNSSITFGTSTSQYLSNKGTWESIPTELPASDVYSWAKAASKPSYTASEVGALPSSTAIPSKTSDLTNDSGFITGYTETDPTVPSWAKQSTKPTYTASEVGAVGLSSGYADDSQLLSAATIAKWQAILS